MLSRQKKRWPATTSSDEDNDQHNNDEGEEVGYGTSHYNPPLIYSAPTVDTLGDESTSIRPYATTSRGPMAQSLLAATTSTTSETLPTTTFAAKNPTSTTKTNPPPGPSTSQRHTRRGPPSTSTAAARNHKHQHKKSSSSPHRPPEFQRVEDRMSLSIRKIPVAERSAFWGGGNHHKEHRHHAAAASPPLMEDIFKKGPQWKKVSPSPQHLYWIHKLQSMDYIRQ